MSTYHHPQLKDLTGTPGVSAKGNAVAGFDYSSDILTAPQLQTAVDAAPLMSVREAVATAQDASVAALLAGATALRQRLVTLDAEIVAAAATYTTARTTYQSALTALPASPSATNIATFLKGAQGAYLLADNTALIALGGNVRQMRVELDNVVKGLGNFIARQTGSTAVLP